MILTDWEPGLWLCRELRDGAELLCQAARSPSAKMEAWVHVGPSDRVPGGSEAPGFANHP